MGVKPLKVAIEKLQEKDTQFTPLHPLFALLCVNAKCYRQALPVIRKKILSGFVNEFHDLYYSMNYNYYRGLLFLGLEEYEQAKHCFKLVIDTPFSTVHILQIQAFKKLALLIWLTSTHNINDDEHKAIRVEIKGVLLAKGVLGKYLEDLCEDYCKAESINNFFIIQNYDSIVKDTNMGLVKQVIKKLRNEVIESMTQTNTMLTIQEIDERLSQHREFCDIFEETQKTNVLKQFKDVVMEDCKLDLDYKDDDLSTILIKMIKSGKIKAKIHMKKKIVVFEDENISLQKLVKQLENQNTEIIEVLQEVERN